MWGSVQSGAALSPSAVSAQLRGGVSCFRAVRLVSLAVASCCCWHEDPTGWSLPPSPRVPACPLLCYESSRVSSMTKPHEWCADSVIPLHPNAGAAGLAREAEVPPVPTLPVLSFPSRVTRLANILQSPNNLYRSQAVCPFHLFSPPQHLALINIETIACSIPSL